MNDSEYTIKVISNGKLNGQYFQSYHNDIFSVDGYSWGNYKQASLILNNAKEFLLKKFPDWEFDLSLEEIETPLSDISLEERNTKNFKLINTVSEIDSNFNTDYDVAFKIRNIAEVELSEIFNKCKDYEIYYKNNNDKKYFLQMIFNNGIAEWEYLGNI